MHTIGFLGFWVMLFFQSGPDSDWHLLDCFSNKPGLQCKNKLSRNFVFEIKRTGADRICSFKSVECVVFHWSLFSEGAFSLLEDFQILDFSHNSIMGIDDNTLVGINTSLLDLGHNNLRKIPTLAFRKMTAVRTLVLDANLFQALETGCIHNIRVHFLSISNSSLLSHIDKGSLIDLPLLEKLTLISNPVLAYIHPGAISGVANLKTLLLDNNNLSSLEDFRRHIRSLRKVSLSGNKFLCHCSLQWLQNLIRSEDGSERIVVANGDNIACGNPRRTLVKEMLSESDCTPLILPLFPQHYEAMVGHNLTWMCKTVGSALGTVAWSIPVGPTLSEGECFQDRQCVYHGKLVTSFLSPEDDGTYTCAAKNKHGNSSRQVSLDVKVICICSTF